ncbi:hypothetical protein E2C01_011314 [Portunus trituberculatus]|uniref:Uncharacterized protein n=1 Tax=Portunus trituberculatus TaxID=210409 RepID=A0A5B7DAS2_PORTR|nr:hypothetical protein [Portunus trituberculatus]
MGCLKGNTWSSCLRELRRLSVETFWAEIHVTSKDRLLPESVWRRKCRVDVTNLRGKVVGGGRGPSAEGFLRHAGRQPPRGHGHV